MSETEGFVPGWIVAKLFTLVQNCNEEFIALVCEWLNSTDLEGYFLWQFNFFMVLKKTKTKTESMRFTSLGEEELLSFHWDPTVLLQACSVEMHYT